MSSCDSDRGDVGPLRMFEPIYRLEGDSLEFEREKMFEDEQSFSPQRSGNRFVSVDTADLGNTRLFRVRSSGHSVSLREPDHVSVLLIRRGRMVVETAAGTLSGRGGDIMVFTPNRRVTHVSPDSTGRFESHCVLVKEDAVSHPHELRKPIERLYTRRSPTGSWENLRRFLDPLFDEDLQTRSPLIHRPRARAAADTLTSELLSSVLDETGESVPSRRLPSRRDHGLARQAEELIRERYREPISTRDVASLLGVSARRLQIALENTRGATPLELLRVIRLEMARERLSNPQGEETITEIAMDSGFSHLGRFARAYAETFGETPSQSLRHGRRRQSA